MDYMINSNMSINNISIYSNTDIINLVDKPTNMDYFRNSPLNTLKIENSSKIEKKDFYIKINPKNKKKQH
jgi:hypothetical protein